ncbi:polysaccharide deacetylase family protein [Eubacteriales bacterium OttesenSCG-928-N14]|nr:polysaccharide deacetylase family protein [Eubacteriales bacterium OttesenSCG-928-N14]
MKKRFCLFLSALLVLALLSACTAPEQPQPTATPSATPDISGLEHLVHEYGEMESIIHGDDVYSCNIVYVQTGIASVDQEITKWAEDLKAETQTEVDEMHKEDDSIEGEVMAGFNSYVVNDTIASVEQIGMYSHSGLAHPSDVVKTFNIDTKKQRLITNDELMPKAKREHLLALMKGKLEKTHDELKDVLEDINESWLSDPLITKDGMKFILARGVLPSAFGMQEVLLTYEELGDSIVLPGAATPQPTHSAKPEETKKPEETATPATPLPNVTPGGNRQIDPNKPMVALTFDDGPAKTTPKILKILEENGGVGTFCMVGNRVKNYEDVVKQVVAQGSEISTHTWDHKKLTGMSEEEILKELKDSCDTIEAVSGVRPRFLRPPYGSVNDKVEKVCKEQGIAIVNWSIDTEDWKTRNADKTYDAIMKDVKDGSIILCHDLHPETGEAMERVIPELVRRGYQLVTVSELVEYREGNIVPGTVYRHAYK